MEGLKESANEGENLVKNAESSLGYVSDDSDIEMLDINTENSDIANVEETCNDDLGTTAVPSTDKDKPDVKETMNQLGKDDIGTTAESCANSFKSVGECSLTVEVNSEKEITSRNIVDNDSITAVSSANSNISAGDGSVDDKVNSGKEVTGEKSFENDGLITTAVSCAYSVKPVAESSLEGRENSEKEVSSDNISADVNKESATVDGTIEETIDNNNADIEKDSANVENTVGESMDNNADEAKDKINEENAFQHHMDNNTDINKESATVETNVEETMDTNADINKESVNAENAVQEHMDNNTDINKESATVKKNLEETMDINPDINKDSVNVEKTIEETMDNSSNVNKERTHVENALQHHMDNKTDINKESATLESNVEETIDNNADINKESVIAENAVEELMEINDKVVDDGLTDISIMITDVRSLSDGMETKTDNKLKDKTVTGRVSPTTCVESMDTDSCNDVNESSASYTIDHTVHDMQPVNAQDKTLLSTYTSNKVLNSSPDTNQIASGTDLPSVSITNIVSASSSHENSQINPTSSNVAIATVPIQASQSSNSFSAVTPLPIPAYTVPRPNIISKPPPTDASVPQNTSPVLPHVSHQLFSSEVPHTSYMVSMPPVLSMKSGADSRSKPYSARTNGPSVFAPTIDLLACSAAHDPSVVAPSDNSLGSVSTTSNLHLSSLSSTSVSEAVMVSSNYPPIRERTTLSVVPSTHKSLPNVGTNFPPANEVVKIEPVDSDDNNQVLTGTSADHMSVMLHKGRKLNSFTSKKVPPPKIVITKVNKKNPPVPSNASSPRILPKRPDNRRTLPRQNIPISDQSAKTNNTLNTTRVVLPIPANHSKASNAVTGKVDDSGEQSVNLKQLSTINIHTVGVPRITDLIARKNPLPAYKPLPVPITIGKMTKLSVHACYECGDTFHLAKSLQQHVGRCIMQINYNCETCGIRHTFTNKCQLLSHLRSHLNIDKSQAVPIHIKSDSIEIVSNFDEIVPGSPFEWFKINPGIVQANNSSSIESGSRAISSVQCGQCREVFDDQKALVEHFEGNKTRHFFCSECTMHLNSSCAMVAHVAFHKLADPSKLSGEEHWKLIKTLQCPECGLKFGERAPKCTPINKYIQDAVHHLGKECFHLSRLTGIECIRCSSVCNGTSGLQNHFQASLEHYYKCELCPMALKSVKNVKTHFIQKHKPPNSSGVHVKAKVIYRCHVCNTLIDDKSFLVQHINMHIEEHKINTSVTFHCLQCGEIFKKKEDLSKHTAESHVHVKRQFICSCKRMFASPLRYMAHVLDFSSNCHPVLTPTLDTRFCDRCGIVCVGLAALRTHSCLSLQEVVILREKSKPEESKPSVINVATTKNGVQPNEEKTSPGGKESSTVMPVNLPAHLSMSCVWCSLNFINMDQREKHLRTHFREKVYICNYCDYKNSKTYHELRSHEITCSAIRKMNSRQAVKNVKPTKEVPADTDEVQLIPKKTASKRPVREVKEYYMCEECSAIFTRKSQKEEHVKSEHGIHPCHLCGIVYDSQSCLKKHLSSDHERKLEYFYCKICKGHNINKSFRNKETLLKHLKVKHRVKVCNDDNIISTTDLPEFGKESTPDAKRVNPTSGASPEVPLKKLRVEGDDVFKCAKCAYVSKSKDEFRQHILKHKATETCQCLECGLCFAVFPSLKKHVFIVHKIKDFDSYMKENSIEEPSMLEDIDVIREPPKPECDSEPSSNEEDEGGNSLECKVCYKQFDTMKNLVAHIRVHGMAFIRKNRRHTKSSKRKIDADEEEKVDVQTDVAENEILSSKNKKIRTDAFSSNNDESKVENVEEVWDEKGDAAIIENVDKALPEKADKALVENVNKAMDEFDETVGDKVIS